MRRFFPSLRDCKIICCAFHASVSGFCASQRERALSLFAHKRVCIALRVGVYTAFIVVPLLRKVFQNCAKPCLVWQCGKRTSLERWFAARIGSPRERTAAPDDEIRILHSDEFLALRLRWARKTSSEFLKTIIFLMCQKLSDYWRDSSCIYQYS